MREIVRLPKVNSRHALPEPRPPISPAALQPSDQSPRRSHLRLVHGGKDAPEASDTTRPTVAAPTQLTSVTRAEFRKQALDVVEQASLAHADSIIIDLAATSDVDASGLGILVLIQKKAKDAGLVTRLARTTPPVRHLLLLTKLDHLFEFVD
jgi:anti-anti-sigma regulatory factor